MNSPGINQIARNIHDGIAQDLVALGYSIDQALAAPELTTTTRIELRTLRFKVTELIEKVRREILNLRSSQPSLEVLAREICADRLGTLDLQVEVEQKIYPLVLELLRNSIQHSGATVINLCSFERDAFTVIEVSDNGNGFVEMKSNRFGLPGVIEQVSEFAGKIDFADLNPGLLIRVSIPN